MGLRLQPDSLKRPWLMVVLLSCVIVAAVAFSIGSCTKNNPAGPPNRPPSRPLIASGAPADSAVDQATALTLAWTSTDPDGDRIVYDVYFGATDPPPKVSNRQPENHYSVSGIAFATRFYWRVVAFDLKEGEASSDTWTFTTRVADLSCLASADTLSGVVPLAVSFRGEARGGKAPYAYSWSFGDGGTSGEQNPSHTYEETGSFTAELSVTDAEERVSSRQVGPIEVICPALSCTASGDTAGGPAPLPVNFTASAEGGCGPYTWRWVFGDGGTSADQNPTHIYETPGDYVATMTVTDSQGHTCSHQVGPIQLPCPRLSCGAGADVMSGQAPLRVDFSGSAQGGCGHFTWQWDFGDGAGSEEQDPTHTYQTPGDYTATMTVSDSERNTCSEQVTPIHVTCPALNCTASGNPMRGDVPLQIAFAASATGGCGPYSWSWSFGDGGSSTEQNPHHTYQVQGDYAATMTVTDSQQHACSEQVAPIHVTCPGLTCGASGYSLSGPAPLHSVFAGSADGGCPPYSWSWSFGDGGSSTEQSPDHTYQTPGNYVATMTVTDSRQQICSKQVAPIHVTCPVLSCGASGNPTGGPSPLQVTFTANAAGGCAPYAWSWSFGDGATSAEQNPVHTYTTPGNYTATMTVTDTQQQICSKQVGPIRVTCPALTCGASGNPTNGPAPLQVDFTATASGGCAPYTWSWTFGDGATSTAQNPTHTYETPGDYTATMTVTDAQDQTCSRQVTPIHVTCPALICAASGNPMGGPAPLLVTFTAGAGGGCAPYTWSWTFGDGSTSTEQDPTHTYESPGDYTATMTVTDAQQQVCSRQVTPIHVTCPALTCSASGNPTSGEAPLDVIFNATAGGGCPPYTWSWAFGDSATSTEQNPTHTYETPGDYTATMTVTDSQQHVCSQEVTPIHVICPHLTCDASADSVSGTAPLRVNFTATEGGGCGPFTWGWDFGDGGASTEQNPSHTYETPGDYTATMTVKDTEQQVCSREVGPIHVACPAMTCTASADTTSGQAPLQVTFTATVGGGCAPYTWSWDFGDGGSSTEQNPVYTYQTPGQYTATMTVTDARQNSCNQQVGPIQVIGP